MIWTLFIIGALTALASGLNVFVSPSNWKQDAVWTFGGLIGAAMMVLAVLFSRGWPA